MKKKRLTTSAILALTLFLSTNAVQADWSKPGFVTQIQYNRDSYENGDVFVWLNDVGCSRTNAYFRISGAATPAEDMDAMVRILMASEISERPVRLGFRPGGTCQVYAVRF